MAKLIYTALVSLDEYIADSNGTSTEPETHEEVHSVVVELARDDGAYLWPPHVRVHGRLAGPADAQSAVLHGGFREHVADRREGPLQSFSGRVRAQSLGRANKERMMISRILINASAGVIFGISRAHPLS